MTITTTTPRAQYNGNGATTAFSVPFEFLEAEGVKVIFTDADGVDATWVKDTHYTLTNNTAAATGTVNVKTTPTDYTPANGTKITILRNQPLKQTTSYSNNDPFPAKSHEKALDRLAMEVQTISEKVSRAPLLKESSANSGLIFPEPEADTVVGWNADGDELENKTVASLGAIEVLDEDDMASNSATKVPTQQSVKAYVDAGDATRQPLDADLTSWAGVTRASGFDTFAGTPSSANLRSLLTDETGTGAAVFGTDPVISVTATGASAARTLASRFAFLMQAEDFGAVADDSTDNTSALAAAIAAFGSAGGVLQFGPGVYRLSTLAVNKKVILQGQGSQGGTTFKSTTLTGDVIVITSSGADVRDISFDATGNRTSGAYIRATGLSRTNFERLLMVKYYIGIDFSGCVSCTISKTNMRDGTPSATASDSTGIRLANSNNIDNHLVDITMDAAGGSMPQYGILLKNSDAAQLVNCDIIHHGADLAMRPDSGESVAATYAVNCFFDTATLGIQMVTSGTGQIPRASFVGCWASSHSSHGCSMNALGGAITTINFVSCQMNFNGGRGLLVNGGAGTTDNIRVLGGNYNSNTSDGIAFASGVTNFSVQGAQAVSNTGNGVSLVGSNDNYQVTGNDLRNNAAAIGGHQGNTSTKIAHSNLGVSEVTLTRQIVTVQGSDVSLTNNITTAQSVFASANDAITLLASTTYRFRARLMIATGTTTHTTAFGFGGTATFTNIHYRAKLWSGTSGTINTTAPSVLDVSAATATVLNATSGAAFTEIEIEGIMRVNGAGTVIPQITFSAGPTGTCAVKVNSFIEFEPIGSNTVAAVAVAA